MTPAPSGIGGSAPAYSVRIGDQAARRVTKPLPAHEDHRPTRQSRDSRLGKRRLEAGDAESFVQRDSAQVRREGRLRPVPGPPVDSKKLRGYASGERPGPDNGPRSRNARRPMLPTRADGHRPTPTAPHQVVGLDERKNFFVLHRRRLRDQQEPQDLALRSSAPRQARRQRTDRKHHLVQASPASCSIGDPQIVDPMEISTRIAWSSASPVRAASESANGLLGPPTPPDAWRSRAPEVAEALPDHRRLFSKTAQSVALSSRASSIFNVVRILHKHARFMHTL